MKKAILVATLLLASIQTYAHSSDGMVICKNSGGVQLRVGMHFEEEDGLTATSNVAVKDKSGRLRNAPGAEVALYNYSSPQDFVIKGKTGSILAVVIGDTLVDASGTHGVSCGWANN